MTDLNRKITWFVGCTFALALSVIRASSNEENDKSDKQPDAPLPRILEVSKSDVGMTLRLPKVCRAGKECNISIELHSKRADDVTSGWFDRAADWHFELRGKQEGLGAKTSYGREALLQHNGGPLRPGKLSSGATITNSFNIARLFDLSSSGAYEIKLTRYLSDKTDQPIVLTVPFQPIEVRDELDDLRHNPPYTMAP